MIKRTKATPWALLVLTLAGCGSSTDDEAKPEEQAASAPSSSVSKPAPAADKADKADTADKDTRAREEAQAIEEKIAYNPPPVPEGYTRLTATKIKNIEPGADITHCEYALAPVDRDMDILDVRGAQSKYGHHVVGFSFTGSGSETMHESKPCGGTEFNAEMEGNGHKTGQGSFLGSATGSNPEGAAFRLKKGDGIMLNIHYINQSEQPIDGEAYLDVKLADARPDRMLATLFTAMNGRFQVDAHGHADSSAECVVKSEVKVVMMANHMHEFGLHAKTEVVRADGKVEMLRDDPSWTYEMQFNPEYTRWSVQEPFVIHSGDTLRTSCSWDNTSGESLMFPREMCISAGFVLVTGDQPSAPGMCNNGTWVSRR